MSIRPALETLTETLRRVNAPLAAQLLNGLDPATIATKLASLPFTVATEIHDYFAWRNGLSLDRPREEELFPEAVMLSLDEALTDYRMLMDVAAQVARQSGAPVETIWNPQWLQIFRHPAGGAYHVTVGADATNATAPIVSVLQQDISGATLAFDSLTTLVATVNECFATGAYLSRDGTIEEDRQRAGTIIRLHNPARVRSATEWLPPAS